MRRGFVLQLARLMGLAPFRREAAYFFSVPWQIYSILVLVSYNAALLYVSTRITFFAELPPTFAADPSLRLLLVVSGCVTAVSTLVFSWSCVAHQHRRLPLLLTQLADHSCRGRETLLLFYSLACFGLQVPGALFVGAGGFGWEFAINMLLMNYFSSVQLSVTVVLASLLLASVRRQYQLINERAENLIQTELFDRARRNHISRELSFLRSCHSNTSETLRSLCRCVGPQLIVIIAFCSFQYVVYIHTVLLPLLAVHPRVSLYTAVAVNSLVLAGASLLALVFSCEGVSQEGNQLQRLLKDALRSDRFSGDEFDYMQRCASFLHINKIEVTLAGAVTIRYKLLLTISSALATYVAILLQVGDSQE